MTETIATPRVIIVGAGLGALYAALELAPCPVLVISPEVLGQGASSAWAQGGVAAAMDPVDTAAAHARDTMGAGAGTVDAAVAEMVTQDARQHILDLTRLGTPFDRQPDGGYVMSREAAHSFARVVRVRGDQAGAEIMRALIAEVRPQITGLVLQRRFIALSRGARKYHANDLAGDALRGAEQLLAELEADRLQWNGKGAVCTVNTRH